MSVQIRRRREAASFLQTYVGAQGELLVDTTDNRVQVHDGTTPGGWPAAGIADLPGRNAIINGTFAINQRGYASDASLAANAYAHDRWKAGSSGAAYTFAQTVPDTQVTVTTGSLIQAVDATNVYATTWWLTWTGTASARVWQGSPSGVFATGTPARTGGVAVNALLVTGLAVGTIANVEFSTGTLGLVQLEAALPNAGPTRFERRLGELAICQGYFRFAQPGIGVWFVGGASGAQAQLQFNYDDMRIAAGIPTISVVPGATVTITDSGVTNTTFSNPTISLNSISAISATVNFATGNGTQQNLPSSTTGPTTFHTALLASTGAVTISKEI